MEITWKDAVEYLVSKVMQTYHVSRRQALQMLAHAFVANVVVCEILDQIDFNMESQSSK